MAFNQMVNMLLSFVAHEEWREKSAIIAKSTIVCFAGPVTVVSEFYWQGVSFKKAQINGESLPLGYNTHFSLTAPWVDAVGGFYPEEEFACVIMKSFC